MPNNNSSNNSNSSISSNSSNAPVFRPILSDPVSVKNNIHEKIIEGIRGKFPIVGKNYTAELENIWIEPTELTQNDQKRVILAHGTVYEKVIANINIVDNKTHRVVDKLEKHRIAGIPYFTNRFTFLIDGSEYNIVNQLRTKPGCYTRKKGNDTLESSFNLSRGANFKLLMNPVDGTYTIDILHATLPLYPFLKILGAPDEAIEAKLGKDLYTRNKAVTKTAYDRTINTLYDKLIKYKYDNPTTTEFHTSDNNNNELTESVVSKTLTTEEKIKKLQDYFTNGTVIDPKTTKITLGREYTHIDYNIVLDAAKKIINVFNDHEDIDERDNLEFQKIHTVEDIIKEVIDKNTTELRKIKYKLDTFQPTENKSEDKSTLKSIFSPLYFTKPIKNFIVSSSISRLPMQINPLEMLDQTMIVTRLGEGAITNERAVPMDSRVVHNSYMGVIDPIATPESDKTGIDNRFTLSAFKDQNNEPCRTLYDIKNQKYVIKPVIDTYHNTIGFPEPLYVKPENKKADDILPALKEGKIVHVKRKDLDYIIPNPEHLHTLTTNSIPFLNNNQANRLLMGAKHVQQALPLVNADTRLVKTPLISTNTEQGGIKNVHQIVGEMLSVKSPCSGIVVKIDDNYIYIKNDQTKKIEKVEYVKYFPLATKTMLHNYVQVKDGEHVTAGDVIATSNFTNKHGELTLGKNLRVAYTPYFGQNHEDGVVISESASKKLTSEYIHKVSVTLDNSKINDKKKFMLAFPGKYTRDQLSKIDDNGVVIKGSFLNEGDPIVLVMQNNEHSVKNKVLGMLHKSLIHKFYDISEVYEDDHPAEVVDVLKHGKYITVILKSDKPATIGDKLSGSWGNKGVITKIVPDDEMYRTKDGEVMDALLTPVGVIGRINPGQTLDTTLGKIAAKKGIEYNLPNFALESGVDFVNKEVEKHGISPTDDLIDPISGKVIPNVFNGVQHTHKLAKTTDSNYAARNIEGAYDTDEAPAGSGKTGPKGMGGMEVNALIGHNLRNIMLENNTIRNSRNSEFWRAFQTGGEYAIPKQKKVFTKFTHILRQAGVSVTNDGNSLRLGPLTDREVSELSSGEISNGKQIGPNFEPESGGLYDKHVLGGIKGEKWGHIKLTEPVINPVFENAVRVLLGGTKQGVVDQLIADGGDALKKRLNAIDIDKEIESTTNLVNDVKLTGDVLDRQVKKLKYLKALKDHGLKPGDAYMQQVIPVTPPVLRPFIVTPGGDKIVSDSNLLYRDLINQNAAIQKMKDNGIDFSLPEMRKSLYNRVSELAGTMDPENPMLRNRGVKGALSYIAGNTPKEGFFQKKVIYSKMNMTGRATIAPDNTLNLDQIGMPVDMAWTLYAPFIIRKLTQGGKTLLEAKKEVQDRTPMAKKILEHELSQRPVLVNRAPTLWRNSIFSAYPVLRDGKTLKVNTLWESSTNADYDGDTETIHVPITKGAVEDAKKILPSKLVFSDKKIGSILQSPKNEAVVGLYVATKNLGDTTTKNNSVKHYITEADAWKDYYGGKLKLTDYVEIG